MEDVMVEEVKVDGLTVCTTCAEGAWVVQVRGEVDMVTAPVLRHHLLSVADLSVGDAGAAAAVVVDLSAVPFLDSSGLTVLIQAHKRLRQRGGGLRLAGVRPPLARLLSMTALDRLLPSYPTAADALAALDDPVSQPACQSVLQTTTPHVVDQPRLNGIRL